MLVVGVKEPDSEDLDDREDMAREDFGFIVILIQYNLITRYIQCAGLNKGCERLKSLH
jgi:hypothetical protein